MLLGLSDNAHSGDWIWQYSYVHAEYTNWASNEPNGFDVEHCVIISKENGDFGVWADFSCDRAEHPNGKLHALCEADVTNS